MDSDQGKAAQTDELILFQGQWYESEACGVWICAVSQTPGGPKVKISTACPLGVRAKVKRSRQKIDELH